MTKVRNWLLLLLPIVVATGTAAARLGYFRNCAFWFRSCPVLECPDTIDLGEQESGKVAIGDLSISNSGTTPLVIDQVETSCSCGGLEREMDGQYMRLDSLEVAPGEKVDLVLRFAVNGR